MFRAKKLLLMNSGKTIRKHCNSWPIPNGIYINTSSVDMLNLHCFLTHTKETANRQNVEDPGITKFK